MNVFGCGPSNVKLERNSEWMSQMKRINMYLYILVISDVCFAKIFLGLHMLMNNLTYFNVSCLL